MNTEEHRKGFLFESRMSLARHLRFGGEKANFEKSGLLLLVAALIGIMTACLARLMMLGVQFVSNFCVDLCMQHEEGGIKRLGLIFLLPQFGFAVAAMVHRNFKSPKSLTLLIYGLNRYRASVPKYEIWTHLVSSVFSVGFGGSAGLEAPGVLTGTAIASTFSEMLFIRGRSKMILIGCGAAAAISAIFRSPVAGVLFTVEALLPSLPVSVLVALTISSASAYLFTTEYLGVTATYYLSHFDPVEGNTLWALLLCGIFCAFVGGFVIRSTAYAGEVFRRLTAINGIFRLVAMLLASGLLLVLPQLRGQGHSFVDALLFGDLAEATADMWLWQKWLSPAALLAVTVATAILLKPLASVLSIECGDGGIFAPTLFIGAATGFAFARVLNMTGLSDLPEANFAALGMCGVFAAVMRSPLTAIFLIIETTQGYSLLLPLMFVSSVAWFIGRFIEDNSIYRRPLVRASLVSDDRVRSALMNIPLPICMKPLSGMEDMNAPAISEAAGSDVAIDKLEENGCEMLIVVDAAGKGIGRVTKGDILEKYLASTVNR